MPLGLGLSLRVTRPGQGVKRTSGLDLNFATGRYANAGPYRATLPATFTFSRTGAGTALQD